MKYSWLIVVVLFQSCANAQDQSTSNAEGKWFDFSAMYYNNDSYAIRFFEDHSKDTFNFDLQYSSSEIESFGPIKSYEKLMDVYMSSTKQSDYDKIYVDAPTIDPQHSRGRYAKEKLKLLHIMGVQLDESRYHVITTHHYGVYEDYGRRTFVLTESSDRVFKLLNKYPPKIEGIVGISNRLNSNSGKLLFGYIMNRSSLEIPKAIQELQEYAVSPDGRYLDINRFNFLLEEWTKNDQSNKINEIFEIN